MQRARWALRADRQYLGLTAVIIAGWLPVLIGRDSIGHAAALFSLAESARPYLVLSHAWLLYVWTPLVVASACVLLLSTGLFLALALNAARGVGQWVLCALALSLLVVSAAAAVMQGLLGTPLRDGAFVAVVVGCAVASMLVLHARLAVGYTPVWPLALPHQAATAVSLVMAPLAMLVALAPKFYWENFNGDGAHAFEAARLLLVQPLPFWPSAAGDVASFPGVTSMLYAFPSSWFIRLFGEVEASARLPFVLYLVALYGGMLALTEWGRATPLRRAERLLLWLGLASYVLTMAFSATYNPYAADIALPATQDTLLVVCFLGFVLMFLRRERAWMHLFLLLTCLSLPNGIMLVGLWLLAVTAVWRPRPWAQIGEAAGGLIACYALAAVLPSLLGALRLPTPGQEYGSAEVLRHLAWLQWADWRRLLYVVVPCGMVPAATLALWRWQDPAARALTLVTVAYFGFFYVTAHVSLHYFVPVMLLLPVIFWRNPWLESPARRLRVLGTAAAGGLAALILSLPTNGTPDLSGRRVGAAIDYRIGEYERVDPAVFRSSEILEALFPLDWDPRVPGDSYGGSPLVWNHYAHQRGSADGANYVLQRASEVPPAGMRLVAERDGAAVYVLSDEVWASHRGLRPASPAGSPIYEVPRGILFRSVALDGGPPIVSVVDVLRGTGFPVDALMDRLRMRR